MRHFRASDFATEMHHVHFLSLFLIFLMHLVSVHMKDFTNAIKRSNYSMPLEIYISYSHNPLGNSKQISHKEKNKYSDNPNRSKRGVLQLYNMVLCGTGCNPLVYKGYGCYCGFLGSGYPVDPIDRCCKIHDGCYDAAEQSCPMFLEYFVPYVWTCYRRQPFCATGWSCGHRLCECDRQLAECLRRYPCPSHKAVCRSSSWRLFQNILTF